MATEYSTEVVDIARAITQRDFEEAGNLFLTIPEHHRKVVSGAVSGHLENNLEQWEFLSHELLNEETCMKDDHDHVVTPAEVGVRISLLSSCLQTSGCSSFDVLALNY